MADWRLVDWQFRGDAAEFRIESCSVVPSATAVVLGILTVPLDGAQRVTIGAAEVTLLSGQLSLWAREHSVTLFLGPLLIPTTRAIGEAIWRAITGEDPPAFAPTCPTHKTTMSGHTPTWTCNACAEETQATTEYRIGEVPV